MYLLNLDPVDELSKESFEFCVNVENHLQRSGCVNRFLANIVFVGLPGSGKTTLIARLLNLKGIDEMLKAGGSTGLMDDIITVNVTEDASSLHATGIGKNYEWQKVEFGISLLRQMGIGCFVMKDSPESLISTNPQEASTSDFTPMSTVKLGASNSVSHTRDALMKEAKVGIKFPATTEKEVEVTPIRRIIQRHNFSKVQPFLNNKSSLYISDTGKFYT